MLYITAVQPTGMFSYGPCDLIRLNENKLVHLIGINEDKKGDSNGSGKTSLFNAVCRVLFGEDPTEVKAPEVANVLWGKGYAGRVEFVSWENVPYRVTDCRDWKDKDYYPVDNDNRVVYKGTNLYFDRWNGSSWIDARGDGMASTRKLIIEALGMSYRRFLSISYLSHRIGSIFLRGKNQERMDILSGVSGVEEWDRKNQEIKEKRTPVNREINTKISDLSYKEGQLSTLRQYLDSIISTDWESSVKLTESNIKYVENNIDSLQATIDNLQKKYDKAYRSTQSSKVIDLTNKKNKLVQEQNELNYRADLPFVETAELQKIKAEINRLKGIKSGYSNDLDLAKLEECPTCGHKITQAQKNKILKKVKEIDDSISRETAKYNSLSSESRKIHDNNRTELLGKIVSLKKSISEVDSDIQKLQIQQAENTAQLDQLARELDQVKASQSSRILEKSQLENQLVDYRKKSEEKKSAIRTIESSSNEVAGLKKEIQKLQDQVNIYDWFVNNIPYIKLHKLSIIMKTLSDRTNEYFQAMGDTIRIDISPFKEKSTKNSADMKDLLKGEINVEVVDGGKKIDTRLYSDGETAKISNALIRALHDIALSFGHGCNLVLLDEIFSFIDGNNSQALAESFCGNLPGMVLVTDNSGIVNNLMNFNETWVARKKNGISKLEK